MRGLIAFLVVLPGVARAHGGQEPGWSADPLVAVPLLLWLALYLLGLVRMRRLGWRVFAALLGWLSLALALLSPLHGWGQRLFLAHMAEHEVMMTVSAPLLVLGRPLAPLLWAVPRGLRDEVASALRHARPGWRRLTEPAVATLLHGATIWIWHMPGVFEATLVSAGLHRAQHLSFLVTALLFWWAMLRRAAPPMAVADLFATLLHTSLLGALLTFAPRVLYPAQSAGAELAGLTPLEDQQLAGLVMWVPGCIAYVAAALGILGGWIARMRSREATHALAG